MNRIKRLASTAALVFLASAPALVSAQESRSDTAAGTVAPSQVQRGEKTFRSQCLECHATKEFLKEDFVKSWNGRPVFELFELIRTSMPEDTPGILSRQEYLDVVTYIAKLNGAPEGHSEIAPEDSIMKALLLRFSPSHQSSQRPTHR